jgi:hypothetical protein
LGPIGGRRPLAPNANDENHPKESRNRSHRHNRGLSDAPE